MKIAIIDVDDICALLTDRWLEDYNADWGDTLTEDKLLGWDIQKYVHPDCGTRIFEYLEHPEIYDNVLPRPGSVEGVNTLRLMNYRVVFATSTPLSTAGRKFVWLQKHGYEPVKKDYVEIDDKSLLRGDIMFDDGFHNVKDFYGLGILLTRPWNILEEWDDRVASWEHLIAEIKNYESFIRDPQ
jgi:5'-nucleotidase